MGESIGQNREHSPAAPQECRNLESNIEASLSTPDLISFLKHCVADEPGRAEGLIIDRLSYDTSINSEQGNQLMDLLLHTTQSTGSNMEELQSYIVSHIVKKHNKYLIHRSDIPYITGSKYTQLFLKQNPFIASLLRPLSERERKIDLPEAQYYDTENDSIKTAFDLKGWELITRVMQSRVNGHLEGSEDLLWEDIKLGYRAPDIPADMALVVWIESGFQDVTSTSGAQGKFQMMPKLLGPIGYPEVFNSFVPRVKKLAAIFKNQEPDFYQLKRAMTAVTKPNSKQPATSSQKKLWSDWQKVTKELLANNWESAIVSGNYFPILADNAVDAGASEKLKWDFAISGYNMGPGKLKLAIRALKEQNLMLHPESFALLPEDLVLNQKERDEVVNSKNKPRKIRLAKENQHYYLRYRAAKRAYKERSSESPEQYIAKYPTVWIEDMPVGKNPNLVAQAH